MKDKSSYKCLFVIGWCKSNSSFCILEICCLILKYILNKCGYVIHDFNEYFLLYGFLLKAYYLLFIFILDYGN